MNTLDKILEAEQIEELSISDLTERFQSDKDIFEFAPDGICQIDPRNGNRILYNSARAGRPHDNRPENENLEQKDTSDETCLICQGKTTGVVDVAELSRGFTFINKNLYPALFPQQNAIADKPTSNGQRLGGIAAYGFHFLQWSSSFHEILAVITE